MHKKFDHTAIEKKWQENWKNSGLYTTEGSSEKPKAYVLDMFPYPSGEGLHVGHPKGYIATDVYSRFKKMSGFEVLHPMGWDAFGLPAENYAIKNKIHPRIAVEKNIANFKLQLAQLGFNYDWSREINTTDPAYYTWTQWIFLKLLEKGLAYESYEPINWCPSCQTGLANEDLESDGTCERCGSVVEKRPMRQWVLKITQYADRMLADLDSLSWPEHIKNLQRNWIGRSQGAELAFSLSTGDSLKVFTTRPDTLFGATYIVVAPEHVLVETLKAHITNADEVAAYQKQAAQKKEMDRLADDREKTGVRLMGVTATNPANGESIPVFVADYVLGHYGTGAIMAVPAHDARDGAFAEKYNLPVRTVIGKPKYLVFDFDGVIGDTYNTSNRAKVRMGFYKNLAEAEETTLRYARTKPNHVRDHMLTPEELEENYEWTRRFGEGMREEKIALFDDFVDEILQIPNAKIAVVSSGSGLYVKPAMEASRISASHVLAFEDHHSKEEKLEQIAKDWGVPVTEIYYFTDTKADVYELEKMLPEGHLVGCAWGYLGAEELEEVLPRAYILENHADIHRIFDVMHTGDGELINSGEFSGMQSDEAKTKIAEFVNGTITSTYKIRDWVFSRQRYWGEPIPVIHCEKCGVVPVPYDQLPVTLPEVEHYAPTGTGESPLADIHEWVNVACPTCGGPGKRETNTMPQWAGSSWYYLRFIDPHNTAQLIDPAKEAKWSPVDVYVGGDHAVRHLIYARFWHKFLYDIGVVSTIEPFARLEFLGFILAPDGRKMSKRWGNIINPTEIVGRNGADTLRVYEMFMGPFENTIAWSADGLVGAQRFLERMNGLSSHLIDKSSEKITLLLNQSIQKVSSDIESFKFNTAISTLMIFLNAAEKEGLSMESYKSFLKLLAPFAPHLSEELWSEAGESLSIHLSSWPQVDAAVLTRRNVTIAVQFGGKTRGTIDTPYDSSEEVVLSAVAQNTALQGQYSQVQTGVKKVFFVPNRVINIISLEK